MISNRMERNTEKERKRRKLGEFKVQKRSDDMSGSVDTTGGLIKSSKDGGNKRVIVLRMFDF